MAKRTADSDDDSPHRKRRKITQTLPSATERHEIRSSRDLQLLLAFHHDVGPAVKQSKNHSRLSLLFQGLKDLTVS